MTSTTEQEVYGDRTVLITMPYIKIYRYYFPLGTSKTILFDEIDYIVYHPGERPDTLWGTTLNHMDHWFPLDELKGYKHGYFEICMKDSTVRPCFSPNDPETAFRVLTKLGSGSINQSKPIQVQMREQQTIDLNESQSPFKDITNQTANIAQQKSLKKKRNKIQIELSQDLESRYENTTEREEIKENLMQNYQLRQF